MTSPAGPALPVDRRELLDAADPCARALLALVRLLVDELEAAAPWSLLLREPPDPSDLRERVRRLLGIIERTPGRIAAVLDDASGPHGEAIPASAREEAEFYFAALHQMAAADRRLVAAALDESSAPAVLSGTAAAYLAEVAADLKGKYASAMMGAAAGLVSDGKWPGFEVEASLFPEKAEEQERNRALLAALAAADADLARLRAEFPWRRLLESWRNQRPVERRALAPLATIRTTLGTLVGVELRRALFAGDYHLLQRREFLLDTRLRDLEGLHFASLDLAAPPPGGPTADYARLAQLLLELAAVLDVDVLRELVGADTVLRLHRQGSSAAALRQPGPASDPLAALLAEEDLAMYVRLLYGEVSKRFSIARDSPSAHRRSSPTPRSVGPAGSRVGSHGSVTRRDEREALRLAAALKEVLARLTGADHDRWRAFQMVHKLQARLQVLPPTLLAEIRPFLDVLQSELLPLVEEAAAGGLLPQATSQTLRSSSQRLLELDLSSLEQRREVSNDLGRIVRLLGSLAVALNGGGV